MSWCGLKDSRNLLCELPTVSPGFPAFIAQPVPCALSTCLSVLTPPLSPEPPGLSRSPSQAVPNAPATLMCPIGPGKLPPIPQVRWEASIITRATCHSPPPSALRDDNPVIRYHGEEEEKCQHACPEGERAPGGNNQTNQKAGRSSSRLARVLQNSDVKT